MYEFKLNESRIADWQRLVIDAELQSGYQFDEELENYLVLTLDHFTTRSRLASGVLAIQLMEAINNDSRAGHHQLRDVGDRCLLLAGLFPERALHKNVSLHYFIAIGRNAYHSIFMRDTTHKHLDPDLFAKLCFHFVGLTDVLHTMRQLQETA